MGDTWVAIDFETAEAQELLDAGQDIEVITEADFLELPALTDHAAASGSA